MQSCYFFLLLWLVFCNEPLRDWAMESRSYGAFVRFSRMNLLDPLSCKSWVTINQ